MTSSALLPVFAERTGPQGATGHGRGARRLERSVVVLRENYQETDVKSTVADSGSRVRRGLSEFLSVPRRQSVGSAVF